MRTRRRHQLSCGRRSRHGRNVSDTYDGVRSKRISLTHQHRAAESEPRAQAAPWAQTHETTTHPSKETNSDGRGSNPCAERRYEGTSPCRKQCLRR